MSLGSRHLSTISLGAYSPVVKVGMGSTFYSLLAEIKVCEIWSMLKGKLKIPTPPLYPKVPFLLNLLYFFALSKCLVMRDWVRGDNTAQPWVSRAFRKKKKCHPEGGSEQWRRT